MPFSLLPREAEAQFNSSSSFGVSGYVRGLAPAIAKLPQCKEEIGSGIKKLFSGIFGSGETGGPIDPNEEYRDTDYSTNSSSDSSIPVDPLPSLEKISKSFTIQVKTSGVSDIEAKKQLEESNKKLERIAKSSEYINENSSCIQSIGRLIAKMLLQKLTMSTVNWINSGYDGSPSFIQDADKFFSDIAKTEILQFGIEIEGISPFSKDWMRNNALALKTKFADNARYSLEEMIAQTTPGCDTNGVVSGVSGVVSGTNGVVTSCSEAFSKDFSVGGWDAWTAMTQVPANNPLGAKLMFDNEIQKRLDGTSQSTAKNTRDALQAASGFLGDQRCVDPKGVTKEEHEKGLRERSNLPQNSEDQMQYQYINRICNKWEYVTPGKMVADAATTVMGYQNNSLLNVEDLNDAVAAISDAILNKFSTNIYEKGFANIGYEGIDGVLVFSGSTERYRTQTQKDYIPSQLSSSWLQANPEFNIRTELTQALIDEQRTYSDKLALQNKELMSTTDGEEYNMGPVCPEDWLGKYPNCEEPPTDIFNILGGLKLPDIFGIYKNPIRVS
ncbi:MAG: hypothetical protein AAB868_00900, partial [Patescibacteria group bacterium]